MPPFNLPTIDTNLCLKELPQYRSYCRSITQHHGRKSLEDALHAVEALPLGQWSETQFASARTILSAMHQAYLDPNFGPHEHEQLRQTTTHYYQLTLYLDEHRTRVFPDFPVKDSFAVLERRKFLQHSASSLNGTLIAYAIEDITGTQASQALEYIQGTYRNVAQFAQEHPQLCIDNDHIVCQTLLGYFDHFAHTQRISLDPKTGCYQMPAGSDLSELQSKAYHNPLLHLLYYAMHGYSQVNSGENLLHGAKRAPNANALLSAVSFSFALNPNDTEDRFAQLVRTLIGSVSGTLTPDQVVLVLQTAQPLLQDTKVLSKLAHFALDHYLSTADPPIHTAHQSAIDTLVHYTLDELSPDAFATYLIQKALPQTRPTQKDIPPVTVLNTPERLCAWRLMAQSLFVTHPKMVGFVNEQGHSFAYTINQALHTIEKPYVKGLMESTFIDWVKDHQMDPLLIAPVFIAPKHCASAALLSLYESRQITQTTPEAKNTKVRPKGL